MSTVPLSGAAQSPPSAPSAIYSRIDQDSARALRDSGLAPRIGTEHTASDQALDAFTAGGRLLRYDVRGRGVFPQQLRVLDVIDAGRRSAAVLLPRQSSKTTSIEIALLGLCTALPGLQVGYTAATTGKAGSEHYLRAIAAPIEAAHPDRATRPVRVRKGAGQQSIEFPNGSRFVVATSPDDFRGSSFDVVWIDEAGEGEGERGDELIAAAMPTQDTRWGVVLPVPLLLLSGTAGTSREGNLLWGLLEEARADPDGPDTAILEYSAGRDLTVEDVATWELAEPLVLASHPGISRDGAPNLTPLAAVRASYGRLGPQRFLAEYLGVFGDEGATAALINRVKWRDAGQDGPLPTPPEHFAVAFGAAPNQASAAVCAAWRDADGRAHVLQLDHREGTKWLREVVGDLGTRYRRVPIGHDSRGVVNVEVEDIARAYPRVRLTPLTTKDVTTAAALLVREVHTGNLVHHDQQALTSAVHLARRRDVGTAWAFGRGAYDDDIVTLEAASLALQLYDATPARRPLPRMVATEA